MNYVVSVPKRIFDLLRVDDSPIHNKGVFVTGDIPAGTIIIEYIGKHVRGNESDALENQDYLFILTEGEKDEDYVYIDGNPEKYPENIAGYINHSCNPNVECVFDYTGERVFFVSLRDIQSGEELKYDYSYPADIGVQTPCNCGAQNCRGFIEGPLN